MKRARGIRVAIETSVISGMAWHSGENNVISWRCCADVVEMLA
jgi:hypothetical protein